MPLGNVYHLYPNRDSLTAPAVGDWLTGVGTDVQISAPVGIIVTASEVQIASLYLPLPALQSRAREVFVVAVWFGSGGNDVVYEPTALFAMEARGGSVVASEAFDQFIERRAAAVALVSSRILPVTSAVKEDSKVLARIRSAELKLWHSTTRDSANGAVGNYNLATCQPCHAASVASWKRSAHAHSIVTLQRQGRAGNKLCLDCHKGSDPRENLARPIACWDCHGTAEHAKTARSSCIKCHTSEADSSAKYRSALDHICSGSGDRPYGSCKR